MAQNKYNLIFLILFLVTMFSMYKVDKEIKKLKDASVKITLEKVAPIIKPIVTKKLKISKDEMNCLALNVYFEARNQNREGQVAVAFVTINRKLNKHFKHNICEVIEEGYKKGSGACSFSWYCDGLHDRPVDEKAWERSKYIANWTVENYYFDPIGIKKADHYHADYIKKPWWSKNMIRVKKIGNHIFYIS